jgi:hypothetical protein
MQSLISCKEQKPLTSIDERLSVTELRVSCAISAEEGQLTSLLCGLILTYWNQSQRFKTLALKWVIVKGQNPEHFVHEV